MKKLSMIFLAFLIFSVPPAYAQNKVRAEGMATIHKNLVDIARDKAIENAQRSAVEKAVGVMITSATEVENYQVKLDQILSESEGFINSYSILSEKREGDAYAVTIEADVGVGKLKDRMAAINLIMARKSKPRVMIIMGEEAQKDAIAEAAMAKYFLTQGFHLLDAGTVRDSMIHEHPQKTSIDGREIARIAHGFGAEVIILGRVEVTVKTFRMSDVEVQSNEVAVSGKVINGDTGEVIATDTSTGKGEVKSAVEQAAADLARQMKEEILERWSTELANIATVKLFVSGLNSYQDLLRFKEIVSTEVKGFKEMYERSYAQGQAELDIELKGDTRSLADDIEVMTMDGRKLKIVKKTQNRIEACLLP